MVTLCEKCFIEHDGNYASGRFCSSKCSYSFSTSKSRKFINEKVGQKLSKKVYLCKICNKSASVRSGGTKKYCSEHRHTSSKDLTWDQLKRDYSRKKRLLKERGNKCEMCGIEKWMDQKVPLVLDHIDGNSDDSRKENLRLICGNCNMQTSTFSGKNKGKFVTRRNSKLKDYRKMINGDP